LACLPLALAAIAQWFVLREVMIFGDTRWYSAGLDGLLSSGPLYDPLMLGPHSLNADPFWDQAPSLAPLTLILIPSWGWWVFGALMTGSVVAGMILIWPRVGIGGSLLLAPALLAWEPVTSALAWANVNALVFLLLAVAIKYPRFAGTALGAATAIKVVPIFGIAWLASRRDWRGVVVAIAIPVVATLIVVTWKGPSTVADFIMLRANQSASGTDLFGGAIASDLLPAIAVALIAYWRSSFSLTVVAMLIAIPVMYFHYLIWLLVPMLVTWLPWLIGKLNSDTPLDWLRTENLIRRPATPVGS
jgi:hypothetical protein